MVTKKKVRNIRRQRTGGQLTSKSSPKSSRPKPRKLDVKIAWKDLVVACAPEQKLELEAILRRYPLGVAVIQNAPNAQISAKRELIKFDNKTMQVYWMLGFASWKAIECYAPAILYSLVWGGSLQQCLDADTGLADVEYGFLAMTGGAKSLLAAPTSTQYAWPHDVPVPGVDRKALPIQQQAAFDLTLMSTAFAFLHELRHVMFRHDDVAQPAAEEELACDVWARAFITSGITNYSRLNQLPYDQVLRKRSMASVVGVFTLYETSCRWGDAGTSDYPPIADRMDAALRGTQLPPNDPFWIYYASILLAILRSRHCHFSVAGATGQEYCESMIDEIRRTS